MISLIRPLILAAVTMLVAPLMLSAAERAGKPNIVLIFADDLGWKDTQYGGSDFYETPHIDRLATQGMVFTAGYATGCFGKWHLGSAGQGTGPGNQGFDVVMEKNGTGTITADPKGIYTITKAACEFIEANRDRPFFAYIPHHAIHSPLQGRQETFDKFKAKPPPLELKTHE
jgi:arylsulfatase A-like enzyme